MPIYKYIDADGNEIKSKNVIRSDGYNSNTVCRQYKYIDSDGTELNVYLSINEKIYHINGFCHRFDGPAVISWYPKIFPNQHIEKYYRFGVLIKYEKYENGVLLEAGLGKDMSQMYLNVDGKQVLYDNQRIRLLG